MEITKLRISEQRINPVLKLFLEILRLEEELRLRGVNGESNPSSK